MKRKTTTLTIKIEGSRAAVMQAWAELLSNVMYEKIPVRVWQVTDEKRSLVTIADLISGGNAK